VHDKVTGPGVPAAACRPAGLSMAANGSGQFLKGVQPPDQGVKGTVCPARRHNATTEFALRPQDWRAKPDCATGLHI